MQAMVPGIPLNHEDLNGQDCPMYVRESPPAVALGSTKSIMSLGITPVLITEQGMLQSAWLFSGMKGVSCSS